MYISKISGAVLDIINNKTKSNLVMTLNNENSALRKYLDGNRKLDDNKYFCTMLESKDYTKNDFSV